MHIVIARSAAGWDDDTYGESLPESSTAETVRTVSEALADEGHSVSVCVADLRLAAVADHLAPAAGRTAAIVFNLARCGPGDAGRMQVPALLDLAGVPYTGPSPLGHAASFDVLLTRALLHQAGVPVAPCDVVRWPGPLPRLGGFPLVAAPRYRRPGVRRRVVRSLRQLADAVADILDAGDQEVVVSQHFEGVELSCCLLGNGDELELLPIIERDEAEHSDPGQVTALGSAPLGIHVGSLAAAAFKAVHCQDCARVLVRFDTRGRPLVVDVDSMPRIDRDSNLVFAGEAGGYGHSRLVSRVLDIAHRRYFGTAAPRFDVRPARAASMLSALHLVS